jgi:DNA-binding NarL/FixJ family response regulator
MQTSVFVCDAHPVVQIGVAACLSGDQSIKVVGSGIWSEGTLQAAANSNPDVLIFDMNQSKESRTQLKRLSAACPTAKLLIFTGASNLEETVHALEAGASGLITKWSEPEELRIAIQRLMRGDHYLEPTVALQVIETLKSAEARRREMASMKLTFREEQVLKCLLQGKTNSQIADHLTISEKTVKHYVGCLKDKFNAANRLEVVLTAQRYAL